MGRGLVFGVFMGMQLLLAQGTVTPAHAEPLSNLDFSSSKPTTTLKNFVSQGSVSISQSGSPMTLTSSNVVTNAQLAAALQVVQDGHQNIVLDYAGRAVGGSLQLSSPLTAQASSILIPQGVTAIRDVGAQGALNLAGSLINYGTILGVSSNSAINTAVFAAQSIVNHQGAVLSTIVPQGGLPGMGAMLQSLNLAVNASESILNSGVISSSANLAINTPMLANGGTISATSDLVIAAPQIQNLSDGHMTAQNLFVNTANLVNAGTLSALGGRLNIENLLGALSINNTGGELISSLGQIEIGSLSELTVSGGKLAAQELFFESKNSTVGVDVDSIVGPGNFAGTCVSVAVKEGALNVSSIVATDDPLLVSNDSDVLLPAGIGSGPLTVIAAGKIIGVANGTAINTNGTDLIMLAGAANITSGGKTTVTGPSGMQGDIINISAIAGGGGDITIGSYNGKLEVKGGISTASGEGKIRIFVPGDISMASLSNVGNHAPGNCIEIVSSIPEIGAGLEVSSTGVLQSGEINAGAAGYGSITTGIVNVDGTTGHAGGFLISAGNKLTTGAILSSGIDGQALGASGFNGGAMSLRAGAGGVHVGGNITFLGGTGVHGKDFTSQPGGNGGNGGSLEIISGGDVILKQLIAYGGGGAGGAGSGIGDVDAGKGGDGGSGGNITIDAGGKLLVGFINVTGGNGGGGGGGCCKGGRGGDGGTSGRTGQNGIQATATGELLGKFPYGELTGGWYEGPGGGWPGFGGYGGGGGSGGWWGWMHGGEGGTGGSGGNVSMSADKGVQTSTIWSWGGGSGGGGGMVAAGGGGASNAKGGRSEDWIVQGDGPPAGLAGVWTGGGGGGGANHYLPGQNGGVFGGNGGGNSSGGPSGGGGAGGWGYGGKGGGWGPTGFGGSITLASLEGSVNVAGELQAFSFTKTAGSVSIDAGKDISVAGVIRTDSGTQSGSISLNSTEGNVLVNGRLDANTFAFNPSGGVTISAPKGIVRLGTKLPDVAVSDLFINTRTQGGPGGSVSIIAGDLISVNGGISTGGGANLLLSTALNPTGNYRSGLILIGGGLNAVNVDIMTGSLRVLGGKGTSSIAAGVLGHVFIQTYGVQPFPTNFDLSSSTANTAALPGAIFTVGDASVNGTAGSISNSTRATPTNASFITESTPLDLNNGAIKIQTTGSTAVITQNGSPLQINASNGAGKRTMVTPGQAVALYQVTRDNSPGAQTITLNSSGQVVDGGTPSSPVPPQLEVPSSDLMLPFSKFTLSTAGTPLKLSLLGSVPSLNLSGASYIDINGEVRFENPEAQATVLVGDKPLLISAGGSITGAETATITVLGSSKSNWTNNGVIEAGSIIFKGTDKGTLKVNMGANGRISAPGGNLGSLLVSTYDFVLNGGLVDNMSFSVLPAGKTVNSVTFSSTLGPTAVFGSLDAKTIKISSTGDFTVRAIDKINATNVLQMSTGGKLFIDGQVQGKDVTLSAQDDLIISAGALVNSTTKTTVLGKHVIVGGTVSGPAVLFQNKGNLDVQSTGVISGAKTLTISSTGNVSQSGNLNSQVLVMNPKGMLSLLPGSQTTAAAKGSLALRPTGGLTIAGNINTPVLTLQPATDMTIESTAIISTPVFPKLNAPGNLTVNGNIQAANVSLNAGKTLTVGATATLTGTVSATLTSNGDMQLAGKVNSPLVTMKSNKGAVALSGAAQVNAKSKVTVTAAKSLSLGNGVSITSGANLLLKAGQEINIGENVVLNSATGSTVQAVANLTAGRDLQMTNTKGNIILTSDKGSVLIGKHSNIQSGVLDLWANHPGRYGVAKAGGIQVKSGSKQVGTAGITIDSGSTAGDESSLRTAGGLLSLVTTGGADIGIGDSATLESNGANLTILSSGNVLGGTGDKITSNVAVNLATGVFYGGGLDVAAGKSTPSPQRNPLVFTVTPSNPPIGSVNITNDPNSKGGILKVDIKDTSTINLSSSGAASAIDITGAKEKQGFGYVSLTSKGDGHVVQFNGGTFTAGKPIAFTEIVPMQSSESDLNDDKTYEIASGSMLICAEENLSFRIAGASLNLRPGAMVLIDADDEQCTIRSLAGPGTAKVDLGSTTIALTAAEEIGIARQRPELNSSQDGIARRRVQVKQLSSNRWYWTADVSLLSLLDAHPELQSVRHGTNKESRKLRDSILKTAAAIQVLGARHGSYR